MRHPPARAPSVRSPPPSRRAAQRLALAALAAAPLALGQTPAPPAAATDQTLLAEVIVTGSRIVIPNLESVSPVTSIATDEVKFSGVTRIEDLLNGLPQAFAAQSAALSNSANGIASVNLRGLGSQRTMVLINGRRLMPGDPGGSSAADLNQIPAVLIERIDVLTGGSSSVYGADAVAGAVNFVLDTHFEGVKLEANYALNAHSNDNPVASVVAAQGFALPDGSVRTGQTRNYDFVYGAKTPDGNGHVVAYAGYRNAGAILQGRYDYSACVLASGPVHTCNGSVAGYPATFVTPNDPTNGGYGYTIGPGNVLRAINPATDFYNFGPLNYFQRPDERRTAGAFAEYRFGHGAQLYGELMYMKDSTVAQVAPSLDLFDLANINCGDPALSPSEAAYFCNSPGAVLNGDGTAQVFVARRNIEGGGRRADFEHEALRVVGGVRGEFADAWKYDAYAQDGTVTLHTTQENYLSRSRLANALNSPDGVQCAVGPPCVPYDIFQLGAVSPQALAYLQLPAYARGRLEERIASASATGDLGRYGLRLPGTEDGLYVNAGAEYRSEQMSFVPDAASQSGDLSGYGGALPPVEGSFHVAELFLEAKLPLVQGARWAQALAAETGYRYSDYSTGSRTNTYKLGLEWQPVRDLELRGSYQRAVRAPNVFELYNSQVVNPDASFDPCSGPVNPLTGIVSGGATAAQCARMGVLPGQYGNITPNASQEYNGLVGGNPQLRPESSDSVTLGLVLSPRGAPGLSVSLDYFSISIRNVISTIGSDLVLDECKKTGDAFLCGLIHRDATGSLWRSPAGYVVNTALNTGSMRTRGVDLMANYRLGLGRYGRLTLGLVGTYLDSLATEPLPGLGSYDCAGAYGPVCGGTATAIAASPRWRHRFRITWATPLAGLETSLAWRYFDAVRNEGYSESPLIHGTVQATDTRLASRSYLDLAVSYEFAHHYSLRAGANNLLDKDPPIVSADIGGQQWNGNTFPGVYDALGRYVYLKLAAQF